MPRKVMIILAETLEGWSVIYLGAHRGRRWNCWLIHLLLVVIRYVQMSLSYVSGTPNIVNGFSHHALVQLPHWLCLCILTMPDTRLASIQPGSRFTISTSPGVDSVTLHFTDKGTKPREVLHHMSEVIPLANSKLDSGLYMPRYFRKKMTWS